MQTLHDIFESRVKDLRLISSDKSSIPVDKLVVLSNLIIEAFKLNKKIAFVGNGGSAAEAMHIAAEFIGKCVVPHKPYRAMCLNESQSVITAVANDFGVGEIFTRMVEAHLDSGDILISLTTSGASENILNAVRRANELGVITVVWMGDFDFSQKASQVWKVPSKSTPRIQEVHLMWGHLLSEAIEIILG